MVFQFHHLLPEFTALENVMMPGLIAGASKALLRKRAESLFEEIDLQHRRQHRPGELSGGEMQRVAVARALMQDPALILADEPSGNLDQTASKSLHKLLWRLSRKDKRTFIIVTHDLELAEDADIIVELFDGRVSREKHNQLT
jgi:lipoprotein-releasing system ATP-binding protein